MRKKSARGATRLGQKRMEREGAYNITNAAIAVNNFKVGDVRKD